MLRTVFPSLATFDNASLDRVWNEMLGTAPAAATGWVPPVDVREEPEAYVIEADLPGVRAEDIQLQFDRGVLSVSGHRKELVTDGTPTYHRAERRWGAFERRFSLPELANGDAIEATYDAGVLTVRVPKKPEARPRQITVKAA